MSAPAAPRRNPGPGWGYDFLSWAERWWPTWIFRPLLMAGTWVGVACMPRQRAYSRAYLSAVFGRPARLGEVWRHFFAFAEMLMRMLRAGRGASIECVLEPENAAAFESLVRSPQSALFGTFHFGGSDLLGYALSEWGRRVSILRHQVGNSRDTGWLGERFSARVSFLWVNDPAQLLFALKSAIEAGESIALKSDRLEFSARNEPFQFLGCQRLFPFTIYHLALLFDRPVVFCTAVPSETDDTLRVFASPVFTPNTGADRAANLALARAHFQGVLAQLEALVVRYPFLWFNFLPLNPAVSSAP
jgi:predicted LPLAT superfamily acyltransferase